VYPIQLPATALINGAYLTGVYLEEIKPLLLYSAQWKKTMGYPILSIDAGFKLDSTGIISLMSAEGYSFGIWCGTASTTAISAQLAAVHRRNVFHNMPTEIIFTDSPELLFKLLTGVFDTLGRSLWIEDSGVRGDTFHIINRIQDTCTPNHPLWPQAMEELLAAMSIPHPKDQEWARQAEKAGQSPLPTVRRLYLPPAVMEPNVTAWGEKWIVHGFDPTTGADLFTQATFKQLDALRAGILKWRYSDAWKYCDEAGDLRPVNMYVELPPNKPSTKVKTSLPAPCFIPRGSLRNESRNEFFFNATNNLAPGGRTGDVLRASVVAEKELQWNVRTEIKLGRMADYGTIDLPQLLRIRSHQLAVKERKLLTDEQVLYGDVPDPSSRPVADFKESQFYAWRADAGLGKASSSTDEEELPLMVARMSKAQRIAFNQNRRREAEEVLARPATPFTSGLKTMTDAPSSWLAVSPLHKPTPDAVTPWSDKVLSRLSKIEAGPDAEAVEEDETEGFEAAAAADAAATLMDMTGATPSPSTRGGRTSSRLAAAAAATPGVSDGYKRAVLQGSPSPQTAVAAPSTAGPSSAGMQGSGGRGSRGSRGSTAGAKGAGVAAPSPAATPAPSPAAPSTAGPSSAGRAGSGGRGSRGNTAGVRGAGVAASSPSTNPLLLKKVGKGKKYSRKKFAVQNSEDRPKPLIVRHTPVITKQEKALFHKLTSGLKNGSKPNFNNLTEAWHMEMSQMQEDVDAAKAAGEPYEEVDVYPKSPSMLRKHFEKESKRQTQQAASKVQRSIAAFIKRPQPVPTTSPPAQQPAKRSRVGGSPQAGQQQQPAQAAASSGQGLVVGPGAAGGSTVAEAAPMAGPEQGSAEGGAAVVKMALCSNCAIWGKVAVIKKLPPHGSQGKAGSGCPWRHKTKADRDSVGWDNRQSVEQYCRLKGYPLPW